MAKKFVRGVTGVEDIEAFDKTLTNVNDIVSDGQDTYVHTKKGKTESYYNLTDSVKQIESTDNMLTITKEDGTVSIANIGLATKEELATKQNTLSVGDGLDIINTDNVSTISISPTKKIAGTNANDLTNGIIYGKNISNAYLNDYNNSANYITLKYDDSNYIQFYIREAGAQEGLIVMGYRFIKSTGVTAWREASADYQKIDTLLNQKQNTIQNNASIGVYGNGLRQLYTLKQTYTHANGFLKTHVKAVSDNSNVYNAQEEFNFTVKINQNAQNIVVTLNEHDKTAFGKIMTTYGSNNTVRISACVFTLSGSSLTVETSNNTNQNYVITFSDILD